jgi:lysyl-tRNA synthetase class 2
MADRDEKKPVKEEKKQIEDTYTGEKNSIKGRIKNKEASDLALSEIALKERQELLQLDEQMEKELGKIKEEGIDAYPAKFEKKVSLQQAFDSKLKAKVKTAGRIMTFRDMGKLCFCHIMDESRKMQIALQADKIGQDKYKWFIKNIDMGDFIGIEGEVFKTHKGEISILVSNYTLLAKALRPLPEKWHGLQDLELRLRERYLDLIMNPEVKEVFEKRSRIKKRGGSIREFFRE